MNKESQKKVVVALICLALAATLINATRSKHSRRTKSMNITSVTRIDPNKAHELLDYPLCETIFKSTEKRLDGTMITCPRDIYVNETLRKTYGYNAKPGKPVDLFVWSNGEPEKRFLTQVGGLPFLPEDRPWPLDSKGRPRIFVAQLSFVDSKDILPIDTPGEVLLIFAETECYDGEYFFSYGEANDGLHFEWVNRENTVPWSREALRAKGYKSVDTTLYGVIYRGMDHFQDDDIEDRLDRDYAKNIVWSTFHIPAFEGTKIAGIPRFIQNGPENYDVETQKTGDAIFIGQLCSVQGARDVEFPWCNEETPIPLRFGSDNVRGSQNSLMIGDAGSIYFFMKPSGEIVWCEECY